MPLAAKLTADVTFGPKFTTATFIVNHTEKNAFKILYEILALVHPNLSSDTSKGPKNPHFEGDFHIYMNKFMNFLTFEDLCGRTYRDSEKVDLVIAAINASKWRDKLSKGVDEATHKHDVWKRSVPRSNKKFPPALKIPTIKQTIMSVYYNENINPLSEEVKNTSKENEESNPAVRRGYYDRNRSRTPTKYHGSRDRGRSRERYDNDRSYPVDRDRRRDKGRQSRSGSPRQYSTNGSGYIDCEFCKLRHRKSTVGCPDFIKYMNLQDFADSKSKQYLQEARDKMLRDRSRSNSASARRGVIQDQDDMSSE